MKTGGKEAENHLDYMGFVGYSAIHDDRRVDLVCEEIRNSSVAHDHDRSGFSCFKFCLVYVSPRLTRAHTL